MTITLEYMLVLLENGFHEDASLWFFINPENKPTLECVPLFVATKRFVEAREDLNKLRKHYENL